MRMPTMLLSCCGLMLGTALAAEAAPAFARKPAAIKDGAGCRIEFASAAPTDCAVYILDAQGKVVRHLAAGSLGETAPAPLKPGLVQSLVWDGKDDFGNPSGGQSFKVRIGLGLNLRPDKVYGGPGGLGACALAVGPTGELYVLGTIGHLHAGDATAVCRVLDREGNYLRTIMPWPGELPPEKTAGFGQLDIAGQGRIPFVHNGENRSLYPDLRQPSRGGAAVSRSGRFIFVDANSREGVDNNEGPLFLMSVEKDGSCPASGFLGPRLPGNPMSCPVLALSPDDKTAYVAGLANGSEQKGIIPIHAVYRVPADGGKDAKPEVFAGDPSAPGADDTHFNDPRGVATDGEGNVYVADFGNDRIIAFKPDGSALGQVKVDKPCFLAVHHKSGVIYVLADAFANKLLRVSGIKDGKVVAGPALTTSDRIKTRRDKRPVLAVDAQTEPPVIWVGTDAWALKRFEDAGGSFVNARDGYGKMGGGAPLMCFDVSLDRKRDALWVRDGFAHLRTCTVLDGRTGARRSVTIPYPPKTYGYSGAILTWGRDDFLYHEIADVPAKGKGIYRYTTDLKPAPFSAEVKYVPTVGSIHLLARGLDVNARGEGVAVKQTDEAGSRQMNHVMRFGPDGKVRKDKLVSGLFAGDCSARIDDAGNVYVATCARPEGEIVPPEFKGQVPEAKRLPDGYPNWYPALCGSIVKFGPEGGAFRTGERKVVVGYGAGRNQSQSKEMLVSGALWMRSGVSQVPLHGGAGGAHYCSCEQMRFDVDGFGRVFAPDTVRFQTVVMDTDGNQIGRFGTYGNIDSQLAGGAALRFVWPEFVLASDEAVYVGDVVNLSILRARVVYQAEETCAVP